MIVMKFGGTSVGSAEMISRVVKIVKKNAIKKPVVVVSAMGGVTDMLIKAAKETASGTAQKNAVEKIIGIHEEAIDKLGIGQSIIEDEANGLRSAIDIIKRGDEVNARILDDIMSFGERMSARIVAACMQKEGIDAKAYDAYDIGMLTDSHFGEANVLPKAYGDIGKRIEGEKKMCVITGFIGRDLRGSITTLGRGGSDYTASIIGAAIRALEIQIWTDVDGIMTADPKVVDGARSIREVSYDEASELAMLGAKVLHPKTILPAMEKEIPVRILNTFNPKHAGTMVIKKARRRSRVASITCKKHIDVIDISSASMTDIRGLMRKIFDAFDRQGISVDVISTSEANISVTTDNICNMAALGREIGEEASVHIRKNMARVSIVGKGLARMPNILGTIFSSLDSIPIGMISSSVSGINQSLVVNIDDADRAVKMLHLAFFGS